MIEPVPILNSRIRGQIDAYWSAFLGCQKDKLYINQETIIYADNSPGVFCLDVDKSRVVSLHPDVSKPPRNTVYSKANMLRLLRPHGMVDELYGPAKLMYITPEIFTPYDSKLPRILTEADREQINDLEYALDWRFKRRRSKRWEYGCGVFHGDRLVSMAAVFIWGNRIAAITVGTLPEYRGLGFGRANVSAVTDLIFDRTDYVPQYDTEASNERSLRIANGLGFQPYGQICYGQLCKGRLN